MCSTLSFRSMIYRNDHQYVFKVLDCFISSYLCPTSTAIRRHPPYRVAPSLHTPTHTPYRLSYDMRGVLLSLQDRYIALGAFGVPCFLVGTRLFWGQVPNPQPPTPNPQPNPIILWGNSIILPYNSNSLPSS